MRSAASRPLSGRKIVSMFERVIQDHESRRAAQAALGAEQAAQARAEREQFIGSFRSMMSHVARPLLEQFAHDAQARGYAALVREGADGDDNPYISITFIPQPGARVGANPADECVCQLKAIPDERLVECASCHDLRPGRDGARILKSDLHAISRGFLETHLEDFLTAALEAREAG